MGVLLRTRPGGVGFSGRQARLRPQGQAGKRYRAISAGTAAGQARAGQVGAQASPNADSAQGNGAGARSRSPGWAAFRGGLVVAGRAAAAQRDQPTVPRRLRAGVSRTRCPPPGRRTRSGAGLAARSYALTSGVGRRRLQLYNDTRSQATAAGQARDEGDEQGRAGNRSARSSRTRGSRRRPSTTRARAAAPRRASIGFDGGSPRPYLKSVDDPYDRAAPYHSWTVRIVARRDHRQAGRPGPRQAARIEVTKTGDSPRIVRARVSAARARR